MAVSSEISTKELQRSALRSYEGKTLKIFLALSDTTPTVDSLISAWRAFELTGNGYAEVSEVIGTGAYDNTTASYLLPQIDAVYTASGGGLSWKEIVVYVDDPVLQAETRTDSVIVSTTSNTITASTGDFTADGFVAGEYVTISGSGSNDGTYEITDVTALVLTINSTTTPLLADETASMTLTRSLLYPYALIEEITTRDLADGQAHTYSITLNTNDA